MVRKAFPLSLVLILTLPLTSYPQDKIQSKTIRVAVVKTVVGSNEKGTKDSNGGSSRNIAFL